MKNRITVCFLAIAVLCAASAAEKKIITASWITGNMTPAGGRVVLTGAAAKIRLGLWPLADDAVVSGSWTVENADGSARRKLVRLFESDGALYLRVDSPGFMLMVR